MGTTTDLKLPYPEDSDQADGPDAFGDLATATEAYFYNRTLPTGIVRAPAYYWGAGTTFPTTGVVTGDSYKHTTLGLHFWNGSAWQQDRPLRIANMASRPASSQAGLYTGFQVTPVDEPWVTWTWTGFYWIPDNWTMPNWFGNAQTGCYLRINGGTAIFTTNSIGAFNISVPYMNQIFAAEMWPGDNTGYLGYISPVPSNYTTTSIHGQAFANGVGIAYGATGPNNTAAMMQIRVNWRTYGWLA